MTPTGNGADSGPTKPSNPKDIIGSRKAPVDLVPDTIEMAVTEAFLEGALKYGCYNWRIAGVRASIYYAAAKRHMKKWWNGQNSDPQTRVHHLKSVIACIGIMLDAELFGKLEDDRPPCPNPDAMAELIDAMEAQVAHLKKLFAEHNPYQFTIQDTPPRDLYAETYVRVFKGPETFGTESFGVGGGGSCTGGGSFSTLPGYAGGAPGETINQAIDRLAETGQSEARSGCPGSVQTVTGSQLSSPDPTQAVVAERLHPGDVRNQL